MKKYFLLLPCIALGATLAQGQTPGTPGAGAQPGQQQTGTAPGQQPGTTGPINPQPGVPATGPGAAGAIVNDPAGAGVATGNTNLVPFGSTNQSRFGGPNPDQFINDPSGANTPGRVPFGGTNQVQFGATNQGTLPTNNTPLAGSGTIQEPSGAAVGQTNSAGTVIPNSAAAADAAFAQQLNAALARGGATRIFFPQTRSTITLVNQNGSILLTGFVADEAEKQSIEARVKNSSDVTAVNNQLRIANTRSPGVAPAPNPAPGTENQRQLPNP